MKPVADAQNKRRLFRRLRVLVAIVLLFGVAAGLHAWFAPKLPRQTLSVGGEFRVLAVRYGAGSDAQAYLRAPRWRFNVWNVLPRFMQKIIPYPEIGPQSESWDHPAVAIWCAWISPQTHEPQLNQFGRATVTLDNGETVRWESSVSPELYHSAHPPPCTPDWPIAAEDYRVIVIVDPPRDSRHFHVEVANVWGETAGETVRFTIDNPAYRRP